MGLYPVAFTNLTEMVNENKRLARLHLQKIKTAFELEGVTHVKILIEEGLAHEVIVDIAKENHCSMVIMSTHGRYGLDRVLLGSVADHVILYSPCPVLLVHPCEDA